jgi:hypothetical protein
MMGKQNPNKVETADGRTPETNANEMGDALDHLDKKPTYADICRETVSPCWAMPSEMKPTEDKLARMDITKKRDGIEETNQD